MKVILSLLLTTGLISCEVSPPYQDRGFRPSPPFNLPRQSNFDNVRQPQTTYGVPNPPIQNLPPIPQTQYGVPNTQNVEPLEGQLYKPPNLTPNFISKQSIPSTSYGVPAAGSNFKIVNSLPQTPFVPPSKLTTRPSQTQEQYGVPNTKNIETFDQIRQAQLLLQAKQASQMNKQNQFGVNFLQSQYSNRNPSILTTQYLPARDAENFNNFQQAQNSERNLLQFSNSNRNIENPAGQYLPLKEANNFNSGFQSPQFNFQPAQNSDRNLLQFSNSNRNVEKPAGQYLPVKEANNFNNGFQSPQFNSQQAQNSDRNLLQFSNSNRNVEKPAGQYLPVKEANNFNNGFQSPQFNSQQAQNSDRNLLQFSNSNRNVENPAAQYLPVKEASNFKYDFQSQFNSQEAQNSDSNLLQFSFPNFQNIRNNPKSNGHDIPGNPQNIEANEFQQSPSNLNFNRPQQQFSTVRPLRPQVNVDVQQLDVRLLNPSNVNRNGTNTQSTQIALPGFNPVQQNRNVGIVNSQQTNMEIASDKYLPPSTTPKSTVFQEKNRPTPTPRATTEFPEEEEQSTVSDEEAGGPNIAVATAVAGAPGGQTFYLLQPDGRLQRVIYQRNQNNGDQENEYTANYHFQNIQADPNVVYKPLISAGK